MDRYLKLKEKLNINYQENKQNYNLKKKTFKTSKRMVYKHISKNTSIFR